MPQLIHKKPDGSDRKLEFGSKPLIVGRVPESDLPVRDSFVSRVHCGISFAGKQFMLKDLGSTNGTYRNGARIFECALASGDKIQVGNTTLVFEIDTTGNAALRQVPQMPGLPTASSAAVTGAVPRPMAPSPPAQPPRPPSLKPT